LNFSKRRKKQQFDWINIMSELELLIEENKKLKLEIEQLKKQNKKREKVQKMSVEVIDENPYRHTFFSNFSVVSW
jgi:regulator of replication initiation timing